eukprot:7377073-Prymnesium_polylepis.2
MSTIQAFPRIHAGATGCGPGERHGKSARQRLGPFVELATSSVFAPEVGVKKLAAKHARTNGKAAPCGRRGCRAWGRGRRRGRADAVCMGSVRVWARAVMVAGGGAAVARTSSA